MGADRVCDQCGRWIEKSEVLYEMRISLAAEPGPEYELEIPEGFDPTRELEEVTRMMENMTNEEMAEAIDQVFEEYRMILCPDCRLETHEHLKRRRSLFGPAIPPDETP